MDQVEYVWVGFQIGDIGFDLKCDWVYWQYFVFYFEDVFEFVKSCDWIGQYFGQVCQYQIVDWMFGQYIIVVEFVLQNSCLQVFVWVIGC